MKVIHFSCEDIGGAGIAAVRYHTLMKGKGVDSILYVKHKTSDDSSIIQLKTYKQKYKQKKIKVRIKNFILNLIKLFAGKSNPVYCFYNFQESNENGLIPDLINQIDIENIDCIFVHWLGGFINTYDLIHLKDVTNARIIFSMMDLEPITGGCHYPWLCTKFESNCIDCPALFNFDKLLAHNQLMSKAANIAYLKADIFSSSFSDLEFAKKSIINFSNYWQIYYPIDEDIFTPKTCDKDNDIITLFANVNSVEDPRKGFNYLLSILLNLDKKLNCKIRFLCLSKQKFSAYNFINIQFEEFDFCKNVNDLVKLYQKTDIFLCASIEDSAPMMLQEALLCGIPSISFDVGVGKQFIEDGKDGFVVPRYDIKEFGSKLYTLIEEKPSSLRSPVQIHNHMVSICGKEVVWNSMKVLLSSK